MVQIRKIHIRIHIRASPNVLLNGLHLLRCFWNWWTQCFMSCVSQWIDPPPNFSLKSKQKMNDFSLKMYSFLIVPGIYALLINSIARNFFHAANAQLFSTTILKKNVRFRPIRISTMANSLFDTYREGIF